MSFKFPKEASNTQGNTVIQLIPTHSISARPGKSIYCWVHTRPNRLVVAKTVDTIARSQEVRLQKKNTRDYPTDLTPPKGHTQKEHETSHGSMSRVRWSIEGPEDTAFEVSGHKFATNDDGAPMMCNLYCADLGRHVHVDYCRSDNPASCSGAEIQHISARVEPNPERAKDWITHSLHWKRMGASSGFSPLVSPLTPRQVSKACQRSGCFRKTNRI